MFISNNTEHEFVERYLYIYIYIYIYIYRFQNVFLHCLTPRLHCFLSSHWPSFRFLSFMAFLIPSIQFFFREIVEVSEERVRKAVRELKNGKSCGPGGVFFERYRHHKAQWLIYILLGLTLKCSMFCSCIMLICSVWIS